MLYLNNLHEQFEQVNEVVASIDDLVENLKSLSNISEDLINSIIGILETTQKLINLLPESKKQNKTINADKDDLLYALDMMKNSFGTQYIHKDFYVWWGIFGTYWSLYSRVIAYSDNDVDIFYLSLN